MGISPADEVRKLIAEEDWAGALTAARLAAVEAAKTGTRGEQRTIGKELLCLGDVGPGSRLFAAPVKRWTCLGREWAGESLAGRKLVVRQVNKTAMGATLTQARFVARAVEDADRCVVAVEQRLVPLFRRSFPKADVRPMSSWRVVGAGWGDLVTSFEGLTGAYATDWASVQRMFVPLRADPNVVAELREKYRRGTDLPVIGVSWSSSNAKKDLPALDDWRRLIESFPARFVSLQYGSIDEDLLKLRGNNPGKLIVDPSVDQLVDMDRFAAQVAAVDAVVSITVTGAHLAGALGKPLVLVLSDQLRSLFPLTGTDSGWYPSAVIARRAKRQWSEAMREAADTLRDILPAKPA
jgi:hypothetical protein